MVVLKWIQPMAFITIAAPPSPVLPAVQMTAMATAHAQAPLTTCVPALGGTKAQHVISSLAPCHMLGGTKPQTPTQAMPWQSAATVGCAGTRSARVGASTVTKA